MPTLPSRIIHVSIERSWEAVYSFAADPSNMPQWASGLASGISQDGEEWVADGGPIGDVRVRFAPSNTYGVMDHAVTLPDGVTVFNPLRVVANHDGAEVMFTLFRQPGMSEEDFERDAAHVNKDLQMLKRLMEER